MAKLLKIVSDGRSPCINNIRPLPLRVGVEVEVEAAVAAVGMGVGHLAQVLEQALVAVAVAEAAAAEVVVNKRLLQVRRPPEGQIVAPFPPGVSSS